MEEPSIPALVPAGLAEAIRRAQVVSFDVFDTALVRACERPVEAFWLVAQAANLPDPAEFARRRIDAEARARRLAWEQRQATEVTLEEIYAQLEPDFGTSAPLMVLERAVEARLCRRHPLVGAAHDYARSLGKAVGFISDIYLERELVAALLEKCGYGGWDFLWVSSEAGVTKSTGELFQRALAARVEPPPDWLHLGDNLDSDQHQARRAGLNSWLVPKCVDLLAGSPLDRRLRRAGVAPLDLPKSAPAAGAPGSPWPSLCRGLAAVQQARPDRDFWWDLGYTQVGLLLLGFALWVGRTADQMGLPKLYFLARDGHIMHIIHQSLRRRGLVCCDSRYLYASRRALNLPALLAIDENACDFLVSGTSRLQVREFLARIGLDPATLLPQIQVAGFRGPDQRVETGTDYGQLRALFRSLDQVLLAQAAAERDLLKEYLRREQLLDQPHIGLVDIGWHGSLQDSLGDLTQLFGCASPLTGFYLGTFPPARRRVAAGADHRAYLCEGGEPSARFQIIHRSVEVFEWLFCAPHGSVLGFRQQADGAIEPLLESGDLEQARHASAERMQAGALRFIEDALDCFTPAAPPPPIGPDLAVSLLAELLIRPSAEEAQRLGDLPHAEGFGNVMRVRPIAQPAAKPYQPLAWLRLYRDYHTAFWKPGYLRRLRPDCW